MRSILFFIAVLTSLACSRKLPPPMPDDMVYIGDCNYYNDYSVKERLSRKPFSQSEKTELVSFDGLVDISISEVGDSVPSPPQWFHGGEIPKKNSKIDRSQLKEIITLSTSQLDSLTNIFFNYDYLRVDKYGIYSESKSGCYEPRQAILFFRKKADIEPFAYFEICLQCRAVETFPKKYELGNFCEGKYDLLREFFRQTGITFGLDN